MDEELKKLEEKYTKNRPTFSLIELIICTALIVAGCVVFSFIPDEMGILGWVLFAVGTLLNIIGIFRLAAMVPGVKDDTTRKIATAMSIVAAVFIQGFGLMYLYNSGGTGKAMAITTLTLCVSLGLIIYALDFDDSEMRKKIKLACKIITALLIVIAVALIVKDDFSDSGVAVATILLIEAAITGNTGFSKK